MQTLTELLVKRAEFIQSIRSFMKAQGILEVDTPLLGKRTVTDPHIQSIATRCGRYLQTSPEFFMKRLLSQGVGDCFQLNKAFRAEECGRKHSHEFTLLEWYRLGFNLPELMQEVARLMTYLLGVDKFDYITYQALFLRELQIDPFETSLKEVTMLAKKHIDINMQSEDIDDWLDLLLTHLIEPSLGMNRPVFLYAYPPSQAALARLSIHQQTTVAERFELYYKGVELANGFDELTDFQQQLQRFNEDNLYRAQIGLSTVELDEDFLAALGKGLPAAAGVAVGVDRLMMLKWQHDSLAEVIPFYHG